MKLFRKGNFRRFEIDYDFETFWEILFSSLYGYRTCDPVYVQQIKKISSHPTHCTGFLQRRRICSVEYLFLKRKNCFRPTRSSSSKIAAANSESRIRQNYSPEVEEMINQQISMELSSSYVYLAMAAYCQRDDVALHGFAKFFKV